MSNVIGTNNFITFLQNVDVANPRYSQYRTGRYVYWYRNINVSYRFKYQPCMDHTGQFWAILAGTERTGRYRKKFILFYFLSFVIFKFLLGQNGNLLH